MAKAVLLCAQPGGTLYDIEISGVEKEEKYTLISHSEGETLSHEVQGPMKCGVTPEVIGLQKGIANFEVRLEDGTSYVMKLP